MDPSPKRHKSSAKSVDRLVWGREGAAHSLAAFLSGSLFFEHQDWLGTERMLTDGAGHTAGSYLSLPFGDGFTDQGTDLDQYHFAGMDHDYESGLDHAQFREYSSAGGRWLSPDPYSGSYDWSNPQSLNRYSYVLNNPLAFLDPTGLSCTDGVGTYGPSSNGDININGNCFPSDGNPDDSWIITDLVDIGEFIAGFFGGHPHIHVGPRPNVAPNNGIASKLACAAKYGQAHSIGAFFGGGPVASFLGGNSVSSILNYGLGLSSSIGPGLGLPTNDVLRLAGKESISGLSSPSGMARSAGTVTAVNSFVGTDSSIISITGETSIASFAGVATNGLTAVRAASVVGVAKLTYDGAAVTYGYFGDCSE